MGYMNYKEYNDYELLNYISENHEEASDILYQKYQPFIDKIARKLYPHVKSAGLEMNDLIQEGLLGLMSAIEHFKEQKDTTFYTYAITCIKRKMISTVVGTKRLKNKILNESIPIDVVADSGDTYSLEYLFGDDTTNPETVLMNSEYESQMIDIAKDKLTAFESNVFVLKISGFEYKEISEILDKDPKAIDNALQRIKSKLKEMMNQKEI